MARSCSCPCWQRFVPADARGRAPVADRCAVAGPDECGAGFAATTRVLAIRGVDGGSSPSELLDWSRLGQRRSDRPEPTVAAFCPGRRRCCRLDGVAGFGKLCTHSASAMVGLPPQGLGVGLLTGIAGVGGGFAVVPALVLLGRLPMALASSTSLLVIAASSLIGLLAHAEWSVEGFRLLIPLLIGGGFGVLLCKRLAPHLSEQRLRHGFAALLLLSAVSSGLEALHRNHAHDVQISVLNDGHLVVDVIDESG